MPWLSRSLCSHARLARLVVRSPIVTAPGRAFTPPPSNFAASRHTLLCHVDSGSVNHLHTMAGFDRFLGTHSGSSSSARMLSTTISNVALPRLTAPTRGLPPSRFSWLTGALLSVTGTRNMSSGKHRRGGARAAPERKVPKLRRQPSKKYKLKSHKGALKRFYQTGHGTFVHKASGNKHLQACLRRASNESYAASCHTEPLCSRHPDTAGTRSCGKGRMTGGSRWRPPPGLWRMHRRRRGAA